MDQTPPIDLDEFLAAIRAPLFKPAERFELLHELHNAGIPSALKQALKLGLEVRPHSERYCHIPVWVVDASLKLSEHRIANDHKIAASGPGATEKKMLANRRRDYIRFLAVQKAIVPGTSQKKAAAAAQNALKGSPFNGSEERLLKVFLKVRKELASGSGLKYAQAHAELKLEGTEFLHGTTS